MEQPDGEDALTKLVAANSVPEQASEQKASLKHDLTKIVVDKLLIGLIVLVAGSYATNVVDKLKSERNFSTELNKTRVEKIGQVWEKLNLYEAQREADTSKLEALRAAVLEAGKDLLDLGELVVSPEAKATPPQTKPINRNQNADAQAAAEPRINFMRASDDLYVDLKHTLNQNRFWLGEESYSEIEKYITLSAEYSKANAQSKRQKDQPSAETMNHLSQLHAQMDEARTNVVKIRDRLLKE